MHFLTSATFTIIDSLYLLFVYLQYFPRLKCFYYSKDVKVELYLLNLT